MTETNDFNAIRISLASPEQIKSWSYGEVTKPETINYRTLKPEKDGLFCERIFGPTKDFECFCGKYKRMRYKGIVCDRCGVEVARSKVRRERMGHIALAAPVSHIWYVKGTPSRLGLLLDISPRILERVLYFAQYIITHVDEAIRDKAIKELREEAERENLEREKAVEETVGQIETDLRAEIEKGKKRTEEELHAEVDKLSQDASSIEAKLLKGEGKKAPKDIEFKNMAIVAKGTPIDASHIGALKDMVTEKVKELESDYHQRIAAFESDVRAQVDAKGDAAQGEINRLRSKFVEDKAAMKGDVKERIDELEDLDPLVMITESRYKELKDKYGSLCEAGMGAEAILDILNQLDLEQMRDNLQEEIHSASEQKRKKAIKRLRVVEALRRSGNRPQWMIQTILPVLPPDLRPMVQLDGGRFATSDLNDLYRRVINRNNRLKRLLELGAPEIIVRNEKRMLQEAVDALIDNGRRGRAITGSHNHKLKSLSDMLRGKQGRFRQNLLGKRVDYSGRSVIVVGPELKLDQCGLPKKMALELFKPFVMHRLVLHGLSNNIKSAKRMVERVKPEVWDVLEEVIKNRPVLLNRAPTLHRLGIQAFKPVLIEGSAIQIHPLVCTAFNADFDGDQMAVHVPLSRAAVIEAQKLMLSSLNMLSPSSGEPTVAPTLDIVMGCYYMTLTKAEAKGTGKCFGSFDEARLAHELDVIDLQAEIEVKDGTQNGRIKTTVGRIIFNEVLGGALPFLNKVIDKKALKEIVAECYELVGPLATAEILDNIKRLGFTYATKSGITISLNDLQVPVKKTQLLTEAEEKIDKLDGQFQQGLITEEERYNTAVQIWRDTSDRMTELIAETLPLYGSIYLMASSGAKGNISQISQMAGMRGLMTDPRGRIIELPIKSSFREGLTVMEYFISTHGARKGLADTALRTADSGYLTRRLIDIAQEVVVTQHDCGTTSGIWISHSPEQAMKGYLVERIVGRYTPNPIVHPETGKTLLERDQEITKAKAEEIQEAGINAVFVRSALPCETHRGVCELCYGRSLARGQLVKQGEAVGVIAAQSIGEPGTQLTMRTFHTGGVVGLDITSGLPRVEELFEARAPKGQAILSEIDGVVQIPEEEEGRKIKVVSSETYKDEYLLPSGYKLLVKDEELVDTGALLARPATKKAGRKKKKELTTSTPPLTARIAGKVALEGDQVSIYYEEKEEREYSILATAHILVENGAQVKAGQELTEGPKNPQDVLRIKGREAVQQYLVEEVQKVYRSQGVTINDKHIEIIVRQMLRKVRVDSPGDTDLLPGELVDRFAYEEINAKVLAEGGAPATAQAVLLGVTKASLNTESFLAAASFQETTKVLTEAALRGSTDRLLGLKENVIIGRLLPARFDFPEFAKPVTPKLLEFELTEELLPVTDGDGEEEQLPSEDFTDRSFEP